MNFLKDSPLIKCSKCECYQFESVDIIKKVSKLASPDGEEAIIPISVFVCKKCGAICDEVIKNPKIAAILSLNDKDQLGLSINLNKEEETKHLIEL